MLGNQHAPFCVYGQADFEIISLFFSLSASSTMSGVKRTLRL
jgi:hypothetical protein